MVAARLAFALCTYRQSAGWSRNAAAGGEVSPGMSVFTDKELDYLAGQRLGRIATVGPDGQPHVVPTSFRYNAEHDAIDVGGLRMSQTKKLRDVQSSGRASIVIDDVLPPWQPRMIEVRGSAMVVPSGGKAFGENFEDTIVRIRPARIIAFGIESGEWLPMRDRSARRNRQLDRALAAVLRPPSHGGLQTAHSPRHVSASHRAILQADSWGVGPR